jgi:hypothetical protein
LRAVLAKIVAGSMIAGAALLADAARDSDRNPEGEDGTASSRSDESAGPSGHRTDTGALPDSMKEQA